MDRKIDSAAPATAEGRIATAPDHDHPVGTILNFQAQTFFSKDPAALVGMKNWDFFKGCNLALYFRNDHEHRVLGSAVLVAPGIALSAAHVVGPMMDAVLEGSESFLCTGIASHGLMIWRPRTVTLIPGTDIGILGLEFCSEEPPENLFFQAAITTRLPVKGEQVLISGFREEKVTPTEMGATVTGNMMIATGPVSAVYAVGRDKHLLPFSSIEVACYAKGGMSGGPAFDASGHLVGIITSSMEDETQSGPTYVSLIWPALGQLCQAPWPVGFYKERFSLLGLDPRLCAIDDRTVLVVENNHAKGTTSIEYHHSRYGRVKGK